jgi:UDP-glucose 4-epimerase
MSASVLIIGVTGFVGSHVARAFLDAGWTVHGFGPAVAAERAPKVDRRVHLHEGSILDAADVARAFTASGASLVLSFAAYSAGQTGLMRSGEADADRALAVNVVGFQRTLEAAREAGMRRVLWSGSTVVYGPPELYESARVDECAACRPRTFYGLTKVMAEDVARFYRDRHGLAVTGLRLPLVIGPGLWYEGAAAELTRLFREAAPGASAVIAGPERALDLMYAKDVAAAFLAAAEAPALDPVYNINGFTASFGAFIAAVRQRVPGYSVEFARRDPPFEFPLVSSSAFTEAARFTPKFGLDETTDDFLRELGRNRAS